MTFNLKILTNKTEKNFSGKKLLIHEWLFLLGLPVILYFVLHVSPINQIGFLDPWLYTGYIHNFDELISRFGLTYYSVRFGLIVPHYVSAKLFGPESGYFITVYGMYLLATVPIYFVIRKHFSIQAAFAAYFLVVSSLWLARSVLWTHPDAAAVPYMLAATSLLYYQSSSYRYSSFFSIGLLLGLAANCNIFTITVSGLMIVPYFVIYKGNLRYHLINFSLALFGFISVFVAGAIGYMICCGTADFIRPTLTMILWSIKGGSLVYKAPITDVLKTPYVYAPLFFFVALLIARKSVPISTSRLADGALAYLGSSIAFIMLWQFMLDGVVLELFYYFCFLIPPAIYCMVMVPAIFLSNKNGIASRLGVAIVVTIPLSLLLLQVYGIADWSKMSIWVAIMIYVLSAMVLVFSRRTINLLAVIPFLAVLTMVWQTKPGPFNPFYFSTISYRQKEIDAYRIALRLMEEMPRMQDDGEPLLFWYKNDSRLLNSIQSIYVWGYSRLSSADGKEKGFPILSDVEKKRLKSEAPVWLVLLSEDMQRLEEGINSLSENKIKIERHKQRSLCEKNTCIYLEILSIRPQEASVSLSALSVDQSVTLYQGGEDDWQQNIYSTVPNLLRRLGKLMPNQLNPPSLLSNTENGLLFKTSVPADHIATPFIDVIARNKRGSPLFVFSGEGMINVGEARCRATIQDEKYNTLYRSKCSNLWAKSTYIELAAPLPSKIRLVLDLAGPRESVIPTRVTIKQYLLSNLQTE